MDKRFLSILAAIVIILVGIFAFSKNSADKKTGTTGQNSSQATSHITGQGKKGVTLIEYGDYQCPVCEVYYQPVKQLIDKYNQDIYLQFRNLPLVSIHPNAFAGARAAEAAGLQNKYWEMHDKLYDNQKEWSTATDALSFFNNYAKDIGLNVSQFTSDYSSSRVNNAINADLDTFKKTGKDQATPTFFLDGQYIDNKLLTDSTGSPSVDKLSALIDAAIAKKAKQS